MDVTPEDFLSKPERPTHKRTLYLYTTRSEPGPPDLPSAKLADQEADYWWDLVSIERSVVQPAEGEGTAWLLLFEPGHPPHWRGEE
jgi:hypothetical protein